MSAHLIGEITLSISSIIYFIWFLPQIYLNFQRKSIHGFSLWMHGLLLLGYTADLLYGFGRHMQWQYRAVTIVGLFCLLIQHAQFFRYGCKTITEKWNFGVLTSLFFVGIIYAIVNFVFLHHSKQYYDFSGFVSDLCWMTYVLPQIIKNFREHSTEGLSVWFVMLSVILSMLDITSTLALHWDWPSVLSEGITLLKKTVLVFQMIYYRPRAWKLKKVTQSQRDSQ